MMNWYKLCTWFLKWLPIAAMLLLVIHVALLILGVTEGWSEYVCQVGLFSVLLLIAASLALKFCIVHRLCIVYNYVVSCCINYEQQYGFGEWRSLARLLVLVVGIVLVILFVRICLKKDSSNS